MLKSLAIALAIAFTLGGCRHGLRTKLETPSEIASCDGSPNSNPGDGGVETAYALMGGCGADEKGLVGEIGKTHIDAPSTPTKPLFQQDQDSDQVPEGSCLTDSCDTKNYSSPRQIATALGTQAYFPPGMKEAVQAIEHDPGTTPDQKAAAVENLIKGEIARFNDAPAGSQPDIALMVGQLLNLSASLKTDPELAVPTIAAGYRTYQSGTSSTEKLQEDSVVTTTNAGFGPNFNTPSLPIFGGFANAGASISIGKNVAWGSSTKTTIKTTTNGPPREKLQIIVTKCLNNGQIMTTPTGAGLLDFASPQTFLLALQSSDRPSGEDFAAFKARADEEARTARSAQQADERQRRLEETRQAEFATILTSQIVYLIWSHTAEDFVAIDPAMINSYTYIYELAPPLLEAARKRAAAAATTFVKASESRNVRISEIKRQLQDFQAQMETPGLSTAAIKSLSAKIDTAQSTLCPVKGMEMQRVALEFAVADLGSLGTVFKRHVAVIKSIAPEDDLKIWVDAQSIAPTEARTALSSEKAGDSRALCASFRDLREAGIQLIAANRSQETDDEAKALTDAAMAMIRADAQKIRNANAAAAYSGDARELATELASERIANHVTEARRAALRSQIFLAETVTTELSQRSDLDEPTRQTIKTSTAKILNAELAKLATALDADGERIFVYLRAEAVTHTLASVRSAILHVPAERRSALLSGWHGLVAASGLRVSSGCLGNDGAESNACWSVEFDFVHADSAALRNFDGQLADLERIVSQFCAASDAW